MQHPAIGKLLKNVKVGSPLTHGNLTFVPLSMGKKTMGNADYQLVSEASHSDSVEITEISDSGSIGEVSLVNKMHSMVLLLGGQELAGGKQDRITNTHVLAAPGSTIRVPVSCVEDGRWSVSSHQFQVTGFVALPSIELAKTQQVSESMRHGSGPHSHQAEIWELIAAKRLAAEVAPTTGALSELYQAKATELEAFVERLPATGEELVGAVFFINDVMSSITLFDTATTFSLVAGDLMRSNALEALTNLIGKAPDAPEIEVRSFLEEAKTADCRLYPGVGAGEEIRFSSSGLSGSAIVHSGRVISLSAYNLGMDEISDSDTSNHASQHPTPTLSWAGLMRSLTTNEASDDQLSLNHQFDQ